MGRKRKTTALDKVVESTYLAGDNGEVIEKSVPVLKHEKSYKYVPELDGPIPPSGMEEELKGPTRWKMGRDGQLINVTQKEKDREEYGLVPIEELIDERPVSKLQGMVNNQSCFIIGGGDSWLPYADLLKANRDRTFGCSGLPLLFPDLRYWYSCDKIKSDPMLYWLMFKSEHTNKVLCSEAWKGEDVPSDCFVCRTPAQGPSENPERDGLWHGCSSVIGAMELARLMGYKVFYLFGLDYTTTAHPFDNLDPQQAQDRKPWDRERIERHWKQVRNDYRGFRCSVFNTNPDSLLVKLGIQPYIDPVKAFV